MNTSKKSNASKFAKFAISTENAAKINGGSFKVNLEVGSLTYNTTDDQNPTTETITFSAK